MRPLASRGLAGAGLAALAAVAALAAAASAAAAADAPGVAYVSALRSARAALPADPGAARAALGAARSSAAPGETGEVDSVVALLDTGALGAAAHALDADIGALGQPPGAEPGDAAVPRQRLDDLYARAPLSRLDEPPPAGSPLARALGWVADRLIRIPVVGLPGAPLLALAAVALVALGSRRLLRRRHAQSERPEPAEEGGGLVPTEAGEWAAATAAAARGDHREAIRRAFRSALLAVAARGRLAVDPAWTTAELLDATRADPELLVALAPAAAAFDAAWYGRRPSSAADWRRERDLCAAIRALAGRRATAAAGGP